MTALMWLGLGLVSAVLFAAFGHLIQLVGNIAEASAVTNTWLRDMHTAVTTQEKTQAPARPSQPPASGLSGLNLDAIATSENLRPKSEGARMPEPNLNSPVWSASPGLSGRMDPASRERMAAALEKRYGVPDNYVSSYMTEWLGAATADENAARAAVRGGKAILLRDGEGGLHFFRSKDTIQLLVQRGRGG
jgi:hypothetical protein